MQRCMCVSCRAFTLTQIALDVFCAVCVCAVTEVARDWGYRPAYRLHLHGLKFNSAFVFTIERVQRPFANIRASRA
jgi:hypothetical protein